MYQQDDLLPSNRNYTLLIGCFTFFFTILIIFVIANLATQQEDSAPISRDNIFVTEKTSPAANLTRYNQDSDRDLLPNFIEEEAILNTYISEIYYCEQSNPVCKSDPYDKEVYLSLIIDASSSTKIPGRGDLTKLDLIKQGVDTIISESINKKYLKTQIVGFGNKGNESFIADNESCVSSILFKNFNQEPKDSSVLPLVLKNYVSNGKSPIGYSIEQVEKSFPIKEGNNIVVLITDGIDDCGQDVKQVIQGVLSREVVKKIHVISVISPQDENDKLKEAAESNGGMFTDNIEIPQSVFSWVDEYIYNDWCRLDDLNVLYQCINRNYDKGIEILDQQINETSPQNEVNKIKEIESSIDLLIQNYVNSQRKFTDEEFNKFRK